ncbi:nucleotidyltransferase family protein [Paenibacillus koleovorans]|uniref:nucleotidyltransferase family protein n=1 Tax=Paenibacillus koleovorans TaxID=121608 RepID=UPI001C3FCC0E|nr:nucleotidyltransferase family protein [Paenibacillus koleovorans]
MPIFQAHNKDIVTQMTALTQILTRSKVIHEVLVLTSKLNLENYYIGAGCIAQTVWNYLSDLPLDYGIKDVDFVYYDNKNLSEEAEKRVSQYVFDELKHLPLMLDVKNQARVHLWYQIRFGYPIPPYKSLEDAINTWPTTATSIGVRLQEKDWIVYAPFGLNDLFGLIVRANKAQITKEIYEQKVSKWVSAWPDLTIIPWESQGEPRGG